MIEILTFIFLILFGLGNIFAFLMVVYVMGNVLDILKEEQFNRLAKDHGNTSNISEEDKNIAMQKMEEAVNKYKKKSGKEIKEDKIIEKAEKILQERNKK